MTSDDNEDRAHIHIKVDPEVKENWELHVSRRNDISSLSALIRLSVSKEIAGDYQQEEEQYDEVVDALNDIHSEVSVLSKQVSVLKNNNIEPGEMEQMLNTVTERMEDLQESD
jgi:peptidoglycan hydrolase CwlO-like protein